MAAKIVGYDQSGRPIYEDPTDGSYTFEMPKEPEDPMGSVEQTVMSAVQPAPPNPFLQAQQQQSPLSSGDSNEQMIDRLLESIIGTQFPARMDSLTGAIPGYQAQAAGSPMAAGQILAPEFADMQRQIQQSLKTNSLKFGPSGGGLLNLGKESMLSPIQQKAASLPGKVRQQGRQGLLDIATNTSILNPSASKSSSTNSTMTNVQQPFDYTGYSMLGQGLGTLAGSPLGQMPYNWMTTPQPASMAGGVPPVPGPSMSYTQVPFQ